MKRSAAIIATTLGVLSFSSCSTLRQYHLTPEGDTPTPTTVYKIDIGEPEFPNIPVADPNANVLAGVADPPCDTTGFPNPCQTPPTTQPTPSVGLCTDGQLVTTGCPAP